MFFKCHIIGLDLTDYLLKIDHFDKMHVLKDEGKIDGAPNFRQVKYRKDVTF